jgi:crotonobetainyl-CoA:carnitine CoA-transferase CaiB-like acyl-CoA transferase
MVRSSPGLPLTGVRVLDFTHWIAGPYCTKLLADFGAEVIKIEPLDGDPGRRLGPFPNDDPTREGGSLFAYLNTSKLGITLNLKTPFAKRIIHELVKEANAVVENFRPGVMERIGFSYKSLNELNPGLVMTSISNFGQTGPYRDWKASELTLYAMGGGITHEKSVERPPVKQVGSVVQFHTGNVAAAATLAGIVTTKLTGEGQLIDVSHFEAELGGMDSISPSYLQGIFPCKDGFVVFATGTTHFRHMYAMLEYDEPARSPGANDVGSLADEQTKEEFEAIFLTWLSRRNRSEILTASRRAGIPCTPIPGSSEVSNEMHIQDEIPGIPTEENSLERSVWPGQPFCCSNASWRSVPAPLLGEHNSQIYGRHLRMTTDDLAHAHALGYL